MLRDFLYSEEWYIECAWGGGVAHRESEKVRDIAHSICQRLVDIILHMSAAEETYLSDDFFFSSSSSCKYFCGNFLQKGKKEKKKTKLDFSNERLTAATAAAPHPDDVSPGTDLGKRQSNSSLFFFFFVCYTHTHTHTQRPPNKKELGRVMFDIL